MLARRPVCLLRVFGVYNKVAVSGDVAIEKQDLSTVDTHGPATAMHVHAILQKESDIRSYRNRIFPVGRHQEVCQFVSPGLHHIISVSRHQIIAGCRVMKDLH